MTNTHIRTLTQKQGRNQAPPTIMPRPSMKKKIIIIDATWEKYHYRRNVAFKRWNEIFESLNIDFWDIELIFKLFFILKCIKIKFFKFYF